MTDTTKPGDPADKPLDAERFRFLALELLNTMTVAGVDVFEEACAIAWDNGREEPTSEDIVQGARVAVDALRLTLESPPLPSDDTAKENA
jgi:hypothetical protein